MQIPRLALTALVSLLALHAGAVTLVRDHAWLTRGAGDEPILGFRGLPWGKFNSLSVTFTLENCTPADIEAFRVYRLPPNRDGCALTHCGTPTLTGAESLRYISGTNDLDPDGDGAFTLTFTQDPNVGGELAHGGSLWVTVDVRETIPVDASITAVPASDLVVDGMRVLTLGAMVEPAGHPTPNRVYPFRHRIAAYTKADVTDLWEREADLRFPTLTDLYVIENGNAACSVTGNALAINDTFRANFLRFKELRDKHHPEMRIAIVIRGSPETTEAVRKAMGADRAAFVRSCVDAMRELGADGMDVDFEYCVTDQQHRDFAGFMGALKDAFMAAGEGWELSMAVTPYHNLPKNAALATVDSINVMAYDGPLNAPYSRMSNFSQNLHSLGVPDRRIVMGQAIYGGYGIQPGWNSIVDLSDYTGYDCDVATRNGTRHTFTGPTTYRGKVRQCLEWDLGGIMSWGYYSDVNWNNLQSLGRHQAQVIRPRTAWDWPEPPLVDGVRELSTEGHWHWFADHAQTVAHARLTADITLTQDPRPIPTFSGTLDGGGHTLTLPAATWIVSYDDAALFQSLSGTVRNLTIDFAGRVISRRDRKFDAGSGSGNGVWLSSSGAGKPGGSAALLAATLSAPAVIDGVRLRLRAGSEIRGQHEVGALAGSLWAGPGTALTVTRCVIDAAGLVQAYGTDSLSREVTMNGNGDVGLLVGQCNWASSAHLTLTDNTVAIRPGAAIRSRLGTHRAAGGCIANLALGLCDSLTLSGLNLFWYGGAVEGPGGFATQPYVGSRNHTTTEGAPTLGPNGTISILDGTTFPDANLWLSDGDTRTLTLPAGLSDKLPAPEPGVTVLRFATDDDADRARFFDGLDISSTFEDNGATQILATAETDFNVSAMGFDADGLWVEASLSHGTFNAATSLQAIPVTLGGTAARAAPIRTLAEEAPERNVRRLRLDLAQSGTHLFRLRPTLTP